MHALRTILLTLSLFLTTLVAADHPVTQVNKVIIWGHKLHTHTHSYLHWGFYRAFKHLGYDTHWLDSRDNIKNIDFSNSLFITEGQTHNGMPVRDDCYYIIHNCRPERYHHLLKNGHAIILQVYTHDCLDRGEASFSQCFHYDLNQPIIYMPWATDLLPHEIDEMKQKITQTTPKNKVATFVGTISTGIFGNQPQVTEFRRAIEQQGYSWQHGGVNSKSMEENIRLIQTAQLAPTLQGTWQCQKGYIPCRIFKNISYGSMGITNSKTVYELLEGKILYNPDPYKLGNLAIQHIRAWNVEKQHELMDLVKEKHTYLNRIERLFNFFQMVENHKEGKQNA